jgi:hypothetical protein
MLVNAFMQNNNNFLIINNIVVCLFCNVHEVFSKNYFVFAFTLYILPPRANVHRHPSALVFITFVTDGQRHKAVRSVYRAGRRYVTIKYA